MTDIVFPPGIAPTNIQWYLRRNVVSAPSFLTRDTQDIDRQGALWGCTLEFGPLAKDKSAALSAWLDQISKASNCGLVPVFQNAGEYQSLSDPAFAEMQPDWYLPGAFTGWGGVQTFSTPTLSGRDLLIYSASGTTSTRLARYARVFFVTPGLPHLITLDIPDQWSPGGYVISDAATTVFANFRTPVPAPGRYQHLVYSTSGFIQVILYPGNGEGAFVKSLFSKVSVCRCYITQGAAVAGANRLTMYGGRQVLGFDKTHQAGQFLSVQTATGYQLVRLKNDVEQIGANSINGASVVHHGRALFEPALRSTVSNMAATQHLRPVCRMKLATPESSSAIGPPLRSSFSIELIERLP